MFALQGAEVLVVGDGDLTPHQRRYLRAGTTSIADDGDAGQDQIDLSTIDVVIESSAVARFEPRALDSDRIVHVAITPFASTGPYQDWRSSDLVDYALSGHSYLYGAPDRARFGYL